MEIILSRAQRRRLGIAPGAGRGSRTSHRRAGLASRRECDRSFHWPDGPARRVEIVLKHAPRIAARWRARGHGRTAGPALSEAAANVVQIAQGEAQRRANAAGDGPGERASSPSAALRAHEGAASTRAARHGRRIRSRDHEPRGLEPGARPCRLRRALPVAAHPGARRDGDQYLQSLDPKGERRRTSSSSSPSPCRARSSRRGSSIHRTSCARPAHQSAGVPIMRIALKTSEFYRLIKPSLDRAVRAHDHVARLAGRRVRRRRASSPERAASASRSACSTSWSAAIAWWPMTS